jgi:hypothetical protein
LVERPVDKAENEDLMRFAVSATSPSGDLTALDFWIDAPVEVAGRSGDFRCAYEVQPVGLRGAVVGHDPLRTIRWAILEMRVKLIHRFPGWTLRYRDGQPIDLDYEENF